MDVGTAKPTAEEQTAVRHHMIDVVDPSQPYSVAEFREAGRAAIGSSDRPILVVGGSGLHFRSLVDPLDFAPTDPDVREAMASDAVDDLIAELTAADSAAADHVDLANPRRVERAVEILRITGETPSERASTPRAAAVRAYEPEVPVVAVGLDPGDGLGARVGRRFDLMLDGGLADEVERLVPVWGETASRAVGYRQMARVVTGEWDLATGRRRSIDATTALSRRQRTWFRRDPRIEWLEWDDDPVRVADVALRRFEEAGWTS
jgi:tRNA dimethylallyltransferase